MSLSPTTMRQKERPIYVTRESTIVRNIVATWHGRSLNVQHKTDLLRALQPLEENEASLYALSPHAPRLLENLRRELQHPRHEQAA